MGRESDCMRSDKKGEDHGKNFQGTENVGQDHGRPKI